MAMIEIIPNWHPIFVHFAVALLYTSTGLFIVAGLLRQGSALQVQVLNVAYWNLWLGFLAAIVTAIAGWIAFNTVAHAEGAHASMEVHRNSALATILLYLPVVFWSVGRARRGAPVSALFLSALLVSALMLAATAWRGGELVYHYGLGVQAVPVSPSASGEHHHSSIP